MDRDSLGGIASHPATHGALERLDVVHELKNIDAHVDQEGSDLAGLQGRGWLVIVVLQETFRAGLEELETDARGVCEGDARGLCMCGNGV